MSDLSPLEFLQAEFKALAPRVVEIEGFPFPLHFSPLNPEQHLKLGKAVREKNAKAQSAMYAEILIETVTLGNGKQAFPLVKGGPNPVEVLTQATPAPIFTRLVNSLIDWLLPFPPKAGEASGEPAEPNQS